MMDVYTVTSFFVAFACALSLSFLLVAVRLRRAKLVLLCLLPGAALAVYVLLSVDRAIDVSFNRILRGGIRPEPTGFLIPPFILGFVTGLLPPLVLLLKHRGSRIAAVANSRRIAAVSVVLLVAQIVIAREITLSDRLALLETIRSGAREFARTQNMIYEPGDPLLVEERIASVEMYANLDLPTSLEFARDGRVFIAERAGTIYTAASVDAPLEPLFHFDNVELRNEAGLLDIELHPSYPDVPYLYVYYTEAPFRRNRLVRLDLRDARNPEPVVMLDDIPAATFHNSGGLAFGRDGMLFVAVGETTHLSASRLSENPPGVQDAEDIRGKVLRVDPDGRFPDTDFSIYARGFRSTFRLRVHPSTGALLASENGPDRDDEVDLVLPNENYGWAVVTGFAGSTRYHDPILTIPDTIGITGIEVYPMGAPYSSLLGGSILFCGVNTGWIYVLPVSSDALHRPLGPTRVLKPPPGTDCRLDLRMNPNGDLFFTSLTGVYRLSLDLT